ncbi:MAG: hypothetical protein ACJAVV_003538, partial [Alphaproteobacteria bacterium]
DVLKYGVINLRFFAPKAKSELRVVLKTEYVEFVDSLKTKHKLLSDDGSVVKFRVNGNFFYDLKATQVLIGKKANQSIMRK